MGSGPIPRSRHGWARSRKKAPISQLGTNPAPAWPPAVGWGRRESLPPRPLTLAQLSTGLAHGLEILEAASQRPLRRRLWSIRVPRFP